MMTIINVISQFLKKHPSSADKLIKVIGGEATSEETQGKDTDKKIR